MISLRFVVAAIAAAASIAVACSPSSQEPACVANLDLACQPLFDPPTYDTLFAKILRPTCASGTGTCHTSDVAMGGLVFEDADASYALLLGKADGRARVVPGNAACSLLVERLESTDPNFRMPKGPTPLLPAERCAIEQWIQKGAAR